MSLKISKKYSLFVTQLLLVKLFATLATLFFYPKLATNALSDADRYLSASFEPSFVNLLDRTSFTDFIFSAFGLLFNPIQIHLLVSFVVAWVIAYLFRESYSYLERFEFWSVFLLPHFLIWTSIVGKEVLVIVPFFLIVETCVDLVVRKRISYGYLVVKSFLCFSVAFLLRPHYLMAYLFLFFSSMAFRGINLVSSRYTYEFSLGFMGSVLLFVASVLSSLIYYSLSIWRNYLQKIMVFTENHFLSYDSAASNRWHIPWETVADFFSNAWWGIPASMVGPTFDEALERPVFTIVFFEGIVSICLIFYFLVKLLAFGFYEKRFKSIVVFLFIPALIIGLIAHYPFGLFNAGSALRYKQSLAPLLYFYPLLLTSKIKSLKFSREGHLKQNI
ncbi:MAG: hypothetical protein AAGG51_05650 [Cyanobacteria bacterium P01_G01_bin.54]